MKEKVYHRFQVVPIFVCNDFSILTIGNKNDAVTVVKIVSPQRTTFVSASDIPNVEAKVFVFHILDVKANCWNGGHNFSEFQIVKDRRLASVRMSNCIQVYKCV